MSVCGGSSAASVPIRTDNQHVRHTRTCQDAGADGATLRNTTSGGSSDSSDTTRWGGDAATPISVIRHHSPPSGQSFQSLNTQRAELRAELVGPGYSRRTWTAKRSYTDGGSHRFSPGYLSLVYRHTDNTLSAPSVRFGFFSITTDTPCWLTRARKYDFSSFISFD